MRHFILILLLIACSAPAAEVHRQTVAVLAMKNGADVTTGEAEIISDRLRVDIFKTGNVEVMEREQMQSVLQEQGFQASGACSDENCLVEMGKVLGVQCMITGSIGKLGTMYLLNFRSIDIKTAKIARVVSVDIHGDIEAVVNKIPDIAWDLSSPPGSAKRTVNETAAVQTGRNQSQSTQVSIGGITVNVGRDSNDDGEAFSMNDEDWCGKYVILERPVIEGALDFSPDKDCIKDLADKLMDGIKNGLEEAMNDDCEIECFSPAQIAKLPADCRSGIVRARLEGYASRPDDDEICGTATITFSFHATAQESVPAYRLTIKKEGDSDEDRQDALVNAFDAVSAVLSDKLEDWDDADCMSPRKR